MESQLMKKQHIVFLVLILIGLFIGIMSLLWYLGEHTYYGGFLIHNMEEALNTYLSAIPYRNVLWTDVTPWEYFIVFLTKWIAWDLVGLIIAGIAFASLPLFYLKGTSKFSLKSMLFLIGGCIVLFGSLHYVLRSNFNPEVNPETNPFTMLGMLVNVVNNIVLFGLGLYTMIGALGLGSFLERKFIKFTQKRWQEIVLMFGIWLTSLLILVQILLQLNLLYGWISVLLFVLLGVVIFFERSHLNTYEKTLSDECYTLLNSPKTSSTIRFFFFSLLCVAFLYLLLGFQNSFIPYSTAWDANHEYMYIPKVLAENGGVLWGNTVAANVPWLWHAFITFFFSLAGGKGLPWDGILGLSKSTIAVSLNFRSAILTLIFWIGIVSEVVSFFRTKEQDSEDWETAVLEKKWVCACGRTNTGKNCVKCGKVNPHTIESKKGIGTLVGRSTLLLWLTSGMGAFLVMVDNKTDLGVMAISSLALLSWIIFIKNFQAGETKKQMIKYILVAGFLFGCACLAKVTAFVDLALFGILFIGLEVSSFSALGMGFILAGVLRYLNILTSSFIINETTATAFIVIGVLLVAGGIVNASLKKRKIKNLILYLALLAWSFGIVFVGLKLPWILYQQTFSDEGMNLTQGLRNLLAEKEDSDRIVSDANPVPSLKNGATCVSQGNVYSEEELAQNVQDIASTTLNEDVGRYIGYGWREFYYVLTGEVETVDEKTGIKHTEEKVLDRNLVYPFAKLLFLKDGCYGANTEAKVLCENSDAVDTFNITVLKKLYQDLKDKDSEGAILLKQGIDAFDQKYPHGSTSYNPQEFRDSIVALRQYYQSHSIKSEDNFLAIPYRFLVPLNISMNRSLQNLSSYYTDIGFVWILFYFIMIVALVYAIIKQERKLLCMSLTTLIGRGIRWIIGWGILWYGTVLISWTMITLVAFFCMFEKKEEDQEEKGFQMIIFIILWIFVVLQLFLNFLRITSQGASGPFSLYKGSFKKVQIVGDKGERFVNQAYTAKSVFDLQFPQYNAIIHHLQDRKDEDGVLIAGTYIQYFLDNQKNVRLDGMLDRLWRKMSDRDPCKTYRRLKNEHLKYLLIDPNIGFVGMGEGNESLFHRFFAKLNALDGHIETDGTITFLMRLYKLWYLKLLSTNNIGAYYAFTLSDDTLREYVGDLSDEELLLKRAKYTGVRYFGDVNQLYNEIVSIFYYRFMSFDAFEDLFLMRGLEWDAQKLKVQALNYVNNQPLNLNNFSEDETKIFNYYLNAYLSVNTSSQRLQDLVANSLTSSSQVIALELL